MTPLFPFLETKFPKLIRIDIESYTPFCKVPMKNASLAGKFVVYEEFLQKRIHSGVKNVNKLFEDLKEEGYTGSYDSLNRYLRPRLKKISTKPYKISKRVETAPGEQAQVDWGSFGKIFINGKEERLNAFVYILSYSRMIFVQFTIKQNLQTLLECHKNAFAKLGIPRQIRYDNMKTVVLRREKIIENYKHHFNPAFYDFHCITILLSILARHIGQEVRVRLRQQLSI